VVDAANSIANPSANTRWIDLDGAVNVRDLGDLPTVAGQVVRRNRLIRSDNLQGLTGSDVRALVDGHDVRAVADLRTGVEVEAEGPGPMTREPLVCVEHFSLFPEAGGTTDATVADEPDGPVVLPWQDRDAVPDQRRLPGAAGVYLGYLDDRPDSALDALRLIATSGGATVVHCAAGKDRAGVITALALSEVGVTREAILDDYALSAERVEAILDRLLSSPTYANGLDRADLDKQRPRRETMQRLLEAIDEQCGGVPAWLRAQGWTDDDAQRLRSHLVG
jgi:protein tyrosine/serine phosphatase